MHQSDFHRKKNFANPNHLFQNPNTLTSKATGQPVAVRSEAENKPDDQKSTEIANVETNNEEVRTEYLLKHPLQNTWTLWYLDNDRSKSWEEMQNEITSFDTVEDFWSLYNHIKPPSELKVGCDYSLFKKGIRPMWEDSANKQGGRWMIGLSKVSKPELDSMWLDVLLCLIGEAFDHSDQVCGAVINMRTKNNKIAIWTADGRKKDANLEIGHKLRDILRLPPNNLLYQLHTDTMVKTGSSFKSIHVV